MNARTEGADVIDVKHEDSRSEYWLKGEWRRVILRFAGLVVRIGKGQGPCEEGHSRCREQACLERSMYVVAEGSVFAEWGHGRSSRSTSRSHGVSYGSRICRSR